MFKKINIFGKNVEVELETDADLSVFEEVLVDRDYRVVDQVIKGAKNCILDIGAHLGFFSIYAGMINQNVKIFAFEPEERNYLLLKKNIRGNYLKNVVAKNVAVGERDGVVALYINKDSHNHSLLKIEDVVGEKKVNVVGFGAVFDKYLARGGVSFCDLVKMDCEGAEFEIINSITPELFKKIGAFYIEYHEYLPELKADFLKSILEKNGFRVKKIPSHYDNRMGFILANKAEVASSALLS